MNPAKLTPEQNDRIVSMLPYVKYVLTKKIPFIPEHLQEDARSVAYVALCRSAVLYDEKRASFKTYAVQSMRKSVLNFLIHEKTKNEHSFEGTDSVSEQARNTYYTDDMLDNLTNREVLKEIYHSKVMSDEIKEAFLFLSCGKTMEETAEILHLPVSSLRNRIIKARQRVLKDERWHGFSTKKKK